jgi:hypothetical protein
MRRFLALALATSLAPAPAQATWLPGGTKIDVGNEFVAAAPSPDRIVVAWIRTSASGHELGVRARAWTAEGDLAPGWSSSGVVLSDLPGYNRSPVICEDGAGGVFVAWVNMNLMGTESNLRLQHVSAAGSLAAGWPAEGLLLATAGTYPNAPAIAHDGAGGALVGLPECSTDGSCHVRVHRIDANGVPNAGWPLGGLSIPNAYDVGLAAQDEHLFVSTSEYDYQGLTGMRIQRLDGNAVPDPGWPQTGATLPSARFASQMRLYPDGTGGVFAGWGQFLICLDLCPPPARWAARILGNGVPDARWGPGRGALSNAPDGTGGMLMGLASGGRPSALRLDASGAAMPGWASGGNAAMTEVVDPWDIWVLGDGEGGAFVAWRDYRTGENRLYASRLDALGRLADGWPATGSFTGARRSDGQVQLVGLSNGVAIAVWMEWTFPGYYTGYLLPLRPWEPGPIADLRPIQDEVGFGIVHVRPNPAHGPIVAIVELKNEGPARLELLDATGRVRETQDFSFLAQARGAVRFNQARALPAGVYWVRLTQGPRVASKKLVVLE